MLPATQVFVHAAPRPAASGGPPLQPAQMVTMQRATEGKTVILEEDSQPMAVAFLHYNLKVLLMSVPPHDACRAVMSHRAADIIRCIECKIVHFSKLQAFDTHDFPLPTSMLQRLCSYA